MQMNKLIFFLVLALSGEFCVFSQDDVIKGVWLTGEEKSQVRIFKATDGKYYGKIEWLKEDKDKKDIHNPDVSKQNTPLMGLVILRGFSYDSENKQWEGGTVYDPKKGKTYDCYLWFDGDNKILHLKGYIIGMRFIGREETWIREDKIRD